MRSIQRDLLSAIARARTEPLAQFLIAPQRAKRLRERLPAKRARNAKVTQRFTEHDLRAKVASDAESLQRARTLLQHADSRTTQWVYRHKLEHV